MHTLTLLLIALLLLVVLMGLVMVWWKSASKRGPAKDDLRDENGDHVYYERTLIQYKDHEKRQERREGMKN